MNTAFQRRLQAFLHDLVARDLERGIQVAVYHEGRLIGDAWAGVADPASGRLVDGETLFCTFSVIKGMTATIIHLLAERGLLAYDTPVANYWPAFAANGKAGITVRQVLNHTAGVPQMPPAIGIPDLADWPVMCARVAQLAPLWEPGTQTGYHALTFGWILGEVAQCVDGRPIAQLLQEEICTPLGIDSLFLGLPDSAFQRVASHEAGPPPPWPPPAEDSLYRQAVPLWMEPLPAVVDRPEIRRAVLPASGGIMNARAIARHYAALLESGVDGVRLLSAERIAQATTLQTEAEDLVLRYPLPKALGYFLGGRRARVGRRRVVFGHEGAGGSIGLADREHQLAIGIAKNRLTDDWIGKETAALVVAEVHAALGIGADE